jgi:membrane associated rhomboid family serine protease
MSGAVAWDAHVGGFLAGLLLFASSTAADQIRNSCCDAACREAAAAASLG